MTAAEKRSGVCMTMSMMNDRPVNRSWLRCRSRSVIACLMLATVLGAYPASLVQHAVDGGLADAGLTGDLADRVRVGHRLILMAL